MALLLGKNKTPAPVNQPFQRKFYGKVDDVSGSFHPRKLQFGVRFAGGKEHGHLYVILPENDLRISDELYITIEKKPQTDE